MDDHSRDMAREEERMEEEEQQNEELEDGEYDDEQEVHEEEDGAEDDDGEPDARELQGWAPDIRRYALSSNGLAGGWWIPWP
jgi:hypothetical protein